MASHAPGDFGVDPIPEPDLAQLVVEDDAPVDNIFSEKQQRLLTEPLYASWRAAQGVPFLACANVGLFTSVREQALVPDVMVSIDVVVDSDFSQRKNKSYFAWQLGKVPELVIEVVSNQVGGELSDKLRKYERARITYYVVFDPEHELSVQTLHVFELRAGQLVQTDDATFPLLGLGLTLWQGTFEGVQAEWLRWSRPAAAAGEASLIPTGAERADRAEAELAALRADLAARGG